MKQEDLIRMAIEAVFDVLSPSEDIFGRRVYTGSDEAISDELECFAKGAYAAGVVAEREACAQVCEAYDDDGGAGEAWAIRFANAIRARGEK